MRSKESDLAEAATILLAVGDGVLADSLRFSLELEGFNVKLCDEHSLLGTMASEEAPGCLVLDQDVFARLFDGRGDRRFAAFGIPVVLLVGHKTERVVAAAEKTGVTSVVEKPLLGGVLFDAIRTVLKMPSGSPAHRPS
jgi:two-component system, LuxR family, response regulator FixJ